MSMSWRDHITTEDRASTAGFFGNVSAPADPPNPRVFIQDDPAPGPEVRAVMDRMARVWPRIPGTDMFYCSGGDEWDWQYVLTFGPLVACEPLPDYRAAVEADAKRRANES